MPKFTPGQFRQSLQNKIKVAPDPEDEEIKPYQIKNLDPSTFSKPASRYAAGQMQQISQSVRGAQSTSSLPKDSIMNKPVHERMKAFVMQNSKIQTPNSNK